MDNNLLPEDMNPDQLESWINSGGLLSKTDITVEQKQEAKASPPPIQELPNDTNPTLEPERTEGFDFRSPVELLWFLDDDVSSGRVKLHDWQIQFMEDFAISGQTDNEPFQALVRACNGSGKDKYIIASCSVWLCMRYIKSRCVVTSSSGVQLDNQTDTYINQLCASVNQKIGAKIWKLNYRYYECLATGSPLLLFATDEPGKAEGYHPLAFGAKMALFESEAKTVPDDIYNAMSRCTGFTHRCLVSSPGITAGHFYELSGISIPRNQIKDTAGNTTENYVEYKVTAYECSHISKSAIERDKSQWGESSFQFRSQYLAEFGTSDELVVIPNIHVIKSKNVPSVGHLKEPLNRGGLDLSAGGDETCLAIRNGNKLLKIIPFKFDNTEETIQFLIRAFEENDLKSPQAYIYADAGGLGKPIIDQLRNRGWSNLRYVLNQSKAWDDRVYKNRGAEMWFNFGKLLETGEIWNAAGDHKLNSQLASRYYKITPENKHQLESKLQARSKGHGSPDRADSVVLCFSDYRSKIELPEFELPYSKPEPSPIVNKFEQRSWVERDDDKFSYQKSYISKDREYLKLQLAEINRGITQSQTMN